MILDTSRPSRSRKGFQIFSPGGKDDKNGGIEKLLPRIQRIPIPKAISVRAILVIARLSKPYGGNL